MSAPPASPTSDVMRPYASRILVRPFGSDSSSPEDDRLARGFWEEITIELARFPALGVVAARSAGTDLHQSGADYAVTGHVARDGRIIRVRAQLLDARDGRQLWADRYDRPVEQLFAIQDEITARVANALHERIDQQSLAAARRRPVTSLAAYEAWLRGFECLQQGTLAADEEARRLFERALEIDPQFARGYAGLSMSYFNEWSCNSWNLWEKTERHSFEYARRAEALDPNDQTVQLILGRIQQYRRHFGAVESHLQRALALAPNDAETIIQLATYFSYQGQKELGLSLAARGLDLHPLCPAWRYPYAALPRFIAGQYQEAIALFQKAPLTLMVDLPAFYASAAAYLGDAPQASAMLTHFDQQFRERISPRRKPDGTEMAQWLRHMNPFRHEADADHFMAGVEIARTMQRQAGGAPPPARSASRVLTWPIANTFRKEGALWILCFDHQVVHVPELKGFRDIARLLASPNDEVHCLELTGRDEARSGGDVLDERARREYRERIRDLQAEIEVATEANDPGRATAAREDLETLLTAIGRATGLGGRSRKLDDAAERARTAVAWRIRKAIQTVCDHHPTLGKHLRNSLHTGVFCRYSPEKAVRWEA